MLSEESFRHLSFREPSQSLNNDQVKCEFISGVHRMWLSSTYLITEHFSSWSLEFNMEYTGKQGTNVYWG